MKFNGKLSESPHVGKSKKYIWLRARNLYFKQQLIKKNKFRQKLKHKILLKKRETMRTENVKIQTDFSFWFICFCFNAHCFYFYGLTYLFLILIQFFFFGFLLVR